MAGIVSRRFYRWTTVNQEGRSIAFMPMSKRLLASVVFQSSQVTIQLFTVNDMMDEIKNHEPTNSFNKELFFRFRMYLPDGGMMRASLDLLLGRFVADERWLTVFRGLDEWFHLSYQKGDSKQSGNKVAIDCEGQHISALLNAGYREFLDDDSIPGMTRALMFLSVLASSSYDMMEEASNNADNPVSHLSVSLARTIINTIDLDRALTGSKDEGDRFSLGFNLFSPASTGESKITTERVGYRSGKAFNDGMYKLFSVLLCRMNGVAVDGANDWVVPSILNASDNKYGLYASALVKVINDRTRIGDATLLRISQLSEVQAQDLCRAMVSGMNISGFRYSRLPKKDLAYFTEKYLTMMLTLSEAGVADPGEMIKISDRVDFPAAAVPRADLRHLELIRGLRKEAAWGAYESHLVSGTLFWLISRYGGHAALEEVIRFWFSEDRDADDLVYLLELADRYLSETAHEPESAIPFPWWLTLTNSAA